MEFFNIFSIKEIVATTVVLFAVINIVGSIPLIIDLRRKVGIIKTRSTSIAVGVIMISFLFLGETILKLIGIDIHSFAVAGSFVVFCLALELVLGINIFKHEQTGNSASIVPLAFPIIAGAGTMTSLVSLRAAYELQNILVAVSVNTFLVFIVLRYCDQIEKLLGEGGVQIIKKISGVILLSIAVKLFQANFFRII